MPVDKFGQIIIISTLLLSITSTYGLHLELQSKNNQTNTGNSTILDGANINHNNTNTSTLKFNDKTSKETFVEGGPIKITKNITDPQSNTTALNATSSNSATAANRTMEEDLRPFGREHIKEPSKVIQEKVIPVEENSISDEPEHKKIVPRKGAIQETTMSTANNGTTDPKLNITTSTTTTTKKPAEKPKKPLITVDNGDKTYPASHFVSKSKNNTKSENAPPTIELYEFNRHKSSGSDYILPIVGVILSVPLVSIILNAIYKRTKEWWHHRHYSRMDFLVDGMYNN